MTSLVLGRGSWLGIAEICAMYDMDKNQQEEVTLRYRRCMARAHMWMCLDMWPVPTVPVCNIWLVAETSFFGTPRLLTCVENWGVALSAKGFLMQALL